jgi:hypothetical protein
MCYNKPRTIKVLFTYKNKLMNNKEAHDFHCKEFTDFYEENQTQEFGEDRSKWDDKDEFASSLYYSLQDYRSEETNPFQLVAYSAGVYSGQVYEEGDGDVFAVAPDLSNLPLVPAHLDLWEFMERLGSPDAHADGAEDALFTFGKAIGDLFANRDDKPTKEELEPLLHSFMRLTCAEYTAVLRCWNSHLSEEEFWQFHDSSHSETFFGHHDWYGALN